MTGRKLVEGGKCMYGHDITRATLYVYRDGRTICRLCHSFQERSHYRKKRGLPPLKQMKEQD